MPNKAKDKAVVEGESETSPATNESYAKAATSEDSAELPTKNKRLSGMQEELQRIGHVYWMKRRLAIPATALVLLALFAAVPFSRYTLLGLFIKQDLTVTVVDSQTNTPISKAVVAIGKQSATTTAAGTARLHANVGYQTLTISKQYYRTYAYSQLIALSASSNHVTVKLLALGRLVPVTVTNKLTGKPVAGVTVKALDTEATTGSDGVATVVLPVTAAIQQATISAKGYNSLSGKLVVTDQVVSANSFAITPAGKLYFLSNLSGKIDVVKTDLDGTNRQTVLAGTGHENQYNTVLLAARDWKYLALYAQRKATGNPEIDLIDTSNDTMSNIDEGDAAFTLIGWAGDHFVYRVDRNGYQTWQNGQQVLKSFDAASKSIIVLAQTKGAGSPSDNIGQVFNGIFIISDKVLYSLYWQGNSSYQLGSKQATLVSVNPDGTGSVVVRAFSLGFDNSHGQVSSFWIQVVAYDKPNELAIAFNISTSYGWDGVGGTQTQYFLYQDGKVSPSSEVNSDTLNNGNYPTYLESPSGKQTFWSVYADGKNNLTVGDQNGQNAKTIAVESDYNPYGRFTDDYLLVQKGGNELYVIATDGSGLPFKITNYYKPQVNYRGYGGGYGGL